VALTGFWAIYIIVVVLTLVVAEQHYAVGIFLIFVGIGGFAAQAIPFALPQMQVEDKPDQGTGLPGSK